MVLGHGALQQVHQQTMCAHSVDRERIRRQVRLLRLLLALRVVQERFLPTPAAPALWLAMHVVLELIRHPLA